MKSTTGISKEQIQILMRIWNEKECVQYMVERNKK